MSKKELRKYVDEYFDKYMCVSFKKFIENWEATNGWLKYFESKQNKLQDRINKALEYIENHKEPLHHSFDEPDCDYWIATNPDDLLDILRGEDNE